MDEISKFEKERIELISSNAKNTGLKDAADEFLTKSAEVNYSYNFEWMGQESYYSISSRYDCNSREIIWEVKPDMIIETGIAHGGSLILSASMLTLLEASGEIENGKVLGIDIDIREHNKKAIESHPMSSKITMFEGSSIDNDMIKKFMKLAKQGKKIMIFLDSMHSHDHVLEELKAYANLTSIRQLHVLFLIH